MVESPVTAPGPDALLATKLHMPGPRPGLVPRPRLLARLDEGLARGLILVCGPAGYGKTVLLADWARRGEFPAAWLSLDAGDNDPARFWRHAVAALDRARPGIGDRRGPAARAARAVLVPGPGHGADQRAGHGRGPARPRRLPPDQLAAGARVARVPGRAPAGRDMRGAGQPQRPAAAAGAAAGPRPADRDTRGRAAVHARGGRGAAPARGVGPAGCVGGGAGGPDRGLGGRAAAGRAVTARAGRCRRFRGRVHRQPPVRPGLPGRRGARAAGRAAAGVPARDLGARPAQRPAVRRRHRPRGQPGAARAGRTGGPVPDPAG